MTTIGDVGPPLAVELVSRLMTTPPPLKIWRRSADVGVLFPSANSLTLPDRSSRFSKMPCFSTLSKSFDAASGSVRDSERMALE